jgi:hypothetical protein
MMKLRALKKKEASDEFHMCMNKGDSVSVTGVSYLGSEDQMRKVGAAKGDAIIHHIVTVSGDTTQGGAEGYATIFAQLKRVKRFVTITLLTLTLTVTITLTQQHQFCSRGQGNRDHI